MFDLGKILVLVYKDCDNNKLATSINFTKYKHQIEYKHDHFIF